MNWEQRYKKASLSHTLQSAYWAIWPEGPKTMSSDLLWLHKTLTNPAKREHIKSIIPNAWNYTKAYLSTLERK